MKFIQLFVKSKTMTQVSMIHSHAMDEPEIPRLNILLQVSVK
jgi:hypothetical protein